MTTIFALALTLLEAYLVRGYDLSLSEIARFHPEINMLPTDDTGKLAAYAWPGGYPILYLDRDNSMLCPACAQKELMAPVAWFIHYEGPPENCYECNTQVASAYGDPNEEE